MAKRRSSEALNPSFSPAEIKKMNKLLVENKEEIFNESFYEKLTAELNAAPGRAKSVTLRIEQVQAWFESNRKCQENEGASSTTASKEIINLSNDEPASLDMANDTEEKAPDVTKLEFEAKSSRDNAWYDVDLFVSYRYSSSKDLEVRVRFTDYGSEDDEWVNVKRAVREQSIPLDEADCFKISEGNLVLCFRETGKQAMYFDAYVTSIERRQHDIRGCRCLFAVRYDHDGFEEVVTARKVCRRPPLPDLKLEESLNTIN